MLNQSNFSCSYQVQFLHLQRKTNGAIVPKHNIYESRTLCLYVQTSISMVSLKLSSKKGLQYFYRLFFCMCGTGGGQLVIQIQLSFFPSSVCQIFLKFFFLNGPFTHFFNLFLKFSSNYLAIILTLAGFKLGSSEQKARTLTT